MTLQAVQLVEERQQPQQHEPVRQQVAAQHVAGPDKKDVRTAHDQHRADHGQRFGQREQQRGGVRTPLFGARLRGADLAKLLDDAGLRVRRAHNPHARERLRQQRGNSVIQIGQLDTCARDPPIDECQRTADRSRERDHQQRQRPGNVAKRTEIEEADGAALQRGDEYVNRQRNAIGFDEKDIGNLAARRAIEQVEVGAVEAPEQRLPQRHRNSLFQIGREHLRDVGGRILGADRDDDGRADDGDVDRR